jgi:hypothetical protein
MSSSMTRLNAVRAFPIGLVVLLVLVVLIRSPSDAPGPSSAADGDAAAVPTSPEAVNGAPAQQGPGGILETPADTPEEPPRTGCFRSGSTRAEVRAAMGEPDQVVAGVWEYGESWVSFGYGTVLDYRNDGGNLRLCQ